MKENSDMLTYAEAAEFAGVCVNTLYGWVSQRRVPYVRLGARVVRFQRKALQAWIDARRVEVQAAGR